MARDLVCPGDHVQEELTVALDLCHPITSWPPRVYLNDAWITRLPFQTFA